MVSSPLLRRAAYMVPRILNRPMDKEAFLMPAPRRSVLLGLAGLSMLPACAGPAQAQWPSGRGTVPDFADLAERVLPAVVNIAVLSEQTTTQIPPELRGTPFERYFRERRGRQQVQGAGSGFIVDPACILPSTAELK